MGRMLQGATSHNMNNDAYIDRMNAERTFVTRFVRTITLVFSQSWLIVCLSGTWMVRWRRSKSLFAPCDCRFPGRCWKSNGKHEIRTTPLGRMWVHGLLIIIDITRLKVYVLAPPASSVDEKEEAAGGHNSILIASSILCSVAATALQMSLMYPQSSLREKVNLFWFLSFFLSMSSVATSLLRVAWPKTYAIAPCLAAPTHWLQYFLKRHDGYSARDDCWTMDG